MQSIWVSDEVPAVVILIEDRKTGIQLIKTVCFGSNDLEIAGGARAET